MDRFVLPRKMSCRRAKFTSKTYLLEGVEYLRPEADAVSALAKTWPERAGGPDQGYETGNMKTGPGPRFSSQFLLVSLFAAFFLQRNRHSFAKTAAGLVNFVRWRP